MNRIILGAIVIVGVLVIASTILIQEPEPAQPNEKIGLVVNTPSQYTSLQDLDQIYLTAAETGIGRSNVYLFWDKVEPVRGEFDWEHSDILLSFNKKNSLDVTLYFSVINGRMLGPFPDWIGNPSLNAINDDHLFNVLNAILSRYDIIDTVIIAGQTESHFRYSEYDIPIYKELFADMYERLKDAHPDVKIGNTFALHNVLNKNLDHIVTELAMGDFVGFTYFPVDSLNDIVKTPTEAIRDLQGSLELVPDKKSGFLEVGWSTSDFVGGSESDQMEFVRNILEFYSANEDQIEFLTWYRQYDRLDGTCMVDPQPVDGLDIEIGGSSGLGSSEHVIERLGHYVCKSGIISDDGIPKPGWHEFQTRLKAAG